MAVGRGRPVAELYVHQAVDVRGRLVGLEEVLDRLLQMFGADGVQSPHRSRTTLTVAVIFRQLRPKEPWTRR